MIGLGPHANFAGGSGARRSVQTGEVEPAGAGRGQDHEPRVDHAARDDAEPLGRAPGEIERAVQARMRPAVVDRYLDAPAGGEVGDPHAGSARKRPVRRRHAVGPEAAGEMADGPAAAGDVVLRLAVFRAVPGDATLPGAGIRLTSAQALALLPPDETIHVQVGQSRSRWRRGNVIMAIRGGSDRRIALASRSAGFGLSFTRDTGESVLVQTDDAKVRGWLERQAKQAGE